jgi:hypothetical protein
MSTITIGIAPQLLAEALALLPHSVKVIGSAECDGYVRLVAEARDIPPGHYSLRVSDSASRRIVDLWPEHQLVEAA